MQGISSENLTRRVRLWLTNDSCVYERVCEFVDACARELEDGQEADDIVSQLAQWLRDEAERMTGSNDDSEYDAGPFALELIHLCFEWVDWDELATCYADEVKDAVMCNIASDVDTYDDLEEVLAVLGVEYRFRQSGPVSGGQVWVTPHQAFPVPLADLPGVKWDGYWATLGDGTVCRWERVEQNDEETLWHLVTPADEVAE